MSGCVLVNCCVYNKSKINNNKNKRGEKNFQDKFKEGRAFSTEGTGRPLFFFSYFPLFLSVVSINSDLNVSSLFCRAMGNRNKQFFFVSKNETRNVGLRRWVYTMTDKRHARMAMIIYIQSHLDYSFENKMKTK